MGESDLQEKKNKEKLSLKFLWQYKIKTDDIKTEPRQGAWILSTWESQLVSRFKGES